jgi:AAA+ ATPase superfamily predicted ATPase
LYEDPRHLLREGEGIRDPGTYLSILRAIATGARRHNEIAQRAGVPTGNLLRKLERLEDLGYVAPHVPLAADGGVDRSRYEIADPYFRFWFRYIAANRSRLEGGRVREVLAEIVSDLDNTMGWAFERCCRRWVSAYADEQAIGAAREVGSWWARDGSTEIDIVGVRSRRYVLLGSCKWRRTVGMDALADLRAQQGVLGPRAAHARLALFARESFSSELRRTAAEQGVLLIAAADLFE